MWCPWTVRALTCCLGARVRGLKRCPWPVRGLKRCPWTVRGPERCPVMVRITISGLLNGVLGQLGILGSVPGQSRVLIGVPGQRRVEVLRSVRGHSGARTGGHKAFLCRATLGNTGTLAAFMDSEPGAEGGGAREGSSWGMERGGRGGEGCHGQ